MNWSRWSGACAPWPEPMPERIVDARWLEPPEPMTLTLAALEALGPGEQVRLLIHRMPHMLFPILNEWHYAYEVDPHADGSYDILIWYQGPDSPGGSRQP